MTAMSQYLEDTLINSIFRGVAFSPPTVYVSLHTAAGVNETSAAWASTELPTNGGYVRTATTTATWTGASGGTTLNALDITFPTATSPWGTVTHIGLWDDPASGNLLFWSTLLTTRSVNTGDNLVFFSQNLTIVLD